MKNILLPIDGSKTCYQAYEYTKNLAKKYDSNVTVLHIRKEYEFPYIGEMVNSELNKIIDDYEFTNVDNPNQVLLHYKDDKYSKDFIDDLSAKILSNAKKYFEKEGINVKSEFLIGKPAKEILDYISKNDFDLVVMCTHGMSAAKRYSLGSVTNKVVHHVDIPILVIK